MTEVSGGDDPTEVGGAGPLLVRWAEAGRWAEAHPGWYVFPGRVEQNPDDGSWTKRPWPGVSWTTHATSGREAVEALWRSVVGEGEAALCVACAPSGLWVLDEDREVTEEPWRGFLELVRSSGLTLVLSSMSRGRPHYVFRQPTGEMTVKEGHWPGGEIKASGMIVVSAAPPLVDTEVAEAPDGLLALVERGRLRGSRGLGLASVEELFDWLAETPLDGVVLSDEVGEAFLGRVVAGMERKVGEGEHRRQAALRAVYQAAIEASAGCYTGDQAYVALKDAYRDLREAWGGPSKGWTALRAADYDRMWCSLVPEFGEGAHDEAIEAKQAELREFAESVGWSGEGLLDESDLDELFDLEIFGGPAVARDPDDTIALTSSPAAEPDPTIGDSGDLDFSSEIEPAPIFTDVDDSSGRAWAAPEVGIDADRRTVFEAIERKEPILGEDAYWGPHGELVERLRGKHEVADVGLLAGLLAEAGVFLSGTCHFLVDGVDVHGPQLFINMIGPSGAARKTHAMNLARGIWSPTAAERSWEGVPGAWEYRREKCKGSGEFIIHRTWAPVRGERIGGEVPDEDVELFRDRRVLFRMPEASVLWKKSRSDGSTLGETFCEMFDQNDLEAGSLTSGLATVSRDAYLVGTYGASTWEVARSHVLGGGLDAVSGFGNRFLWLWLPDSGIDLPDGGGDLLALPEVAEYRAKWAWRGPDGGKGAGFGETVDWSPRGRDLWWSVYSDLKRAKGTGAVVTGLNGRAEAYVKRLALGYELSVSGVSGVVRSGVGEQALKAALAVWWYCRDSVVWLFGDSSGDPDVDMLVKLVRRQGGAMLLVDVRSETKWSGARVAEVAEKAAVSRAVSVGAAKPAGRTGGGRPSPAIFVAEWTGTNFVATGGKMMEVVRTA